MEIVVILAIVGWVVFKVLKYRQQRMIADSVAMLMQHAIHLREGKRKEILSKGIAYVPDNPAEGVFQMVNFPYETYEEWEGAFTKAVLETNPSMKIDTGPNGKALSLFDMMDDEPSRRAYAHHLDPKLMGKYAAQTFDLRKVKFQDGVTTGEFIDSLSNSNTQKS